MNSRVIRRVFLKPFAVAEESAVLLEFMDSDTEEQHFTVQLRTIYIMPFLTPADEETNWMRRPKLRARVDWLDRRRGRG
jgi:hypothetical protein